MFCSNIFQKMAYEYIAISDHPDDIITLSVGQEAEAFARIHYKGSLKRGLNPSSPGVLVTSETTTSTNNNEVINEFGCSSSSGMAIDAPAESTKLKDDSQIEISGSKTKSDKTTSEPAQKVTWSNKAQTSLIQIATKTQN